MRAGMVALFTMVLAVLGAAVAWEEAPSPSRPPEGMVLIPGGAFRMGIDEGDLAALAVMGGDVPHMSETHARWWFGDEVPRHQVVVEPFYMDEHEVTNAEFRAFVEAAGYEAEGPWHKHAGSARDNHPVVHVTWRDARAYAEWAGKRLPTEAEWEYAARGGGGTCYPWGDEADPVRANYRSQGESFFDGLVAMVGLRPIGTTPAGSYESNGYGLFDMIGNVAEWCENERLPYPEAIETVWPYRKHGPWGQGRPVVHGKAVRGGSWQSANPVFVRITGRTGFPPDTHNRWLGFRCVKPVSRQSSSQ